MKRSVITSLAIASAVAVSLTGRISINTGGAKTAAPAATGAAPAPVATTDYSGALTQLGGAIGALAKSSGAAPKADDCGYTALVANTMESNTPAPAWQGKYETIRSNMHNIAALCALNPTDADAREEASLTRVDVVTILNQESYLGKSNWS